MNDRVRLFLGSIRTDLFIVVLLVGSLSLNVYLGITVKRLGSTVKRAGSTSSDPPNSGKLSPGTNVRPVIASNLSGKQESISYADSVTPTVFYVFSPSCKWCELNTKNINAIMRVKGGSFRFIGLALSDEGLVSYLEAHHLDFPVYKDVTPESAQMLGLGGTPQTIVIGSDGKVLRNWFGAFNARLQPEVEGFFNIHLPGLAEPKTQ